MDQKLMKLLAKALGESGEEKTTFRERAQKKLLHAEKTAMITKKLLALIDEIGEAKIERMIALTEGHDPDEASVIGPHGLGCFCPPDDEKMH